MAYEQLNKLLLIQAIQDIYARYKEDDVTTASIYRKYIYPVYFISYATFYNYLAVPVKKKLRELEELKERQNKKLKQSEANSGAGIGIECVK